MQIRRQRAFRGTTAARRCPGRRARPACPTRRQFAAAVLEAFLVPRGRVRNGRGRGPHLL